MKRLHHLCQKIKLTKAERKDLRQKLIESAKGVTTSTIVESIKIKKNAND